MQGSTSAHAHTNICSRKIIIHVTLLVSDPAAGITADFARDKAKVARSYTWELMPRTGKRLSGFSPSENLVPFYTPTIWRGLRAYAVAVADEVGITAEDVFLGGDVVPSVPNPYRDSILEAFKNSSMYPALLQALQNGK